MIPAQRLSARALEEPARLDARNPALAVATGDWNWRLSIAEIEEDAPFSRFDGIERELVLLSGNGLRLRFDDGEPANCSPPHERAATSPASARVTGELVDGPTQDFNLMWRRDAIDAQLWHRPLVGPMVMFVEPGSVWAVHLLAGQARFADASGLPELAMADTALLVARRTRANASCSMAAAKCWWRAYNNAGSKTAAVIALPIPNTLRRPLSRLRPRAHIHSPDIPSSSMPMAKLSASSVHAMPPPTPLCKRADDGKRALAGAV